MILSSNLVWLDDIAKLWAFEVEGSKWQNRQYHTLRLYWFWALNAFSVNVERPELGQFMELDHV